MDFLIDPYRMTPVLPACYELIQIEKQHFFIGGIGFAPGGPVVTAKADFLAACSSYVNANMDHLPPYPTTDTIKPSSTVTIWGGLGTVSTDNNFVWAFVADTASAGSYPGRFNTTSPSSGNWLDADTSVNITLSSPRNAFCCYITDLGDFTATFELQLFLGATLVKTVAVPFVELATSEVLHVGYLNGAILFDKIRLQINQNDPGGTLDSVGFDELVVGMANACVA